MSEKISAANKARVPEGVSSGGEFTTAHLEEPPPMKLYDRDSGTCFNPPMSRTAEHAIRFWENVEIPDVTIAKAVELYNAQQNADFTAFILPLIETEHQRWLASNPYPRLGDAKQAKWVEAKAEAFQRIADDTVVRERDGYFHSENPQTIGTRDAQQVVRAWFTATFGPVAEDWPDEFDKTIAHQIEMSYGYETIGAIAKRYRLGRFSDEITRVPDPVTDAIGQMNNIIAGILKSMSVDVMRTADHLEGAPIVREY